VEGSGVHHLYVETHGWDASVAFWEALGFKLDTTFAGRGDGILRPTSGPYVFLRVVPEGQPLAIDVVLAADDLEFVAAQSAVRVARPPYDAAWGPRMIDIADPDERSFNVRKNDGW
jgi:catechol 2,3-dioxygenase-like lactoylglutathione lyase family enzyme